MRNQSSMTLREKIWSVFVRTGRRNGLLRMGILAVAAVYLFCYHLYRNVKRVSAMRYACLFCAGMLAMNCVYAPVRIWAEEQENASETEPDQGKKPGGLKIAITGPDASIVEGYQDTVPYRIKLTNPEDGIDLNLKVRTSGFGDVYVLVMNEETGEEEEVLVYRHLEKEDPESGDAEEPGDEGEDPESGDAEEPGDEGEDPESGDTEEPGDTEEDPESGDTEEDPESGDAEEPGDEGEDPEAGDTESEPEEGNTETDSESGGTEEDPENAGDTEEDPEEGNAETDPEAGDTENAGEPKDDSEEGNTETAGEPEDDSEEGNTEIAGEPETEASEGNLPELLGEPGVDPLEIQGEGETPESLDESVIMRLARGESLSYVVRIPTGLPAGEYTETVIFQAEELSDPIKRSISFIVESADKVEVQPPTETDPSGKEDGGDLEEGEQPPVETDPSGQEGNGDLEEGEQQPPTETDPSEKEDGGDPEEGEQPPTESEDPSEKEDGGDPEEGEQPPTESEDPSEQDGDGGDLEEGEQPPTESDSEGEEGEENDGLGEEPALNAMFEVVSREGGYYMGNTFFVMSTAVYELKVDTSAVAALFCNLNGESFELPVLDGYASFTVPETFNGTIGFYALGQDGSVTEELTEYVIAEKTAPSLEYENVDPSSDGTWAVHVILEDCGEVISGLSDVECVVDGVAYTEYTPNVFGKVLLCSGEEVVSGFSFDIPLQDNEIHTIEIIASDNVGNVLNQSFRVNAPQTDVISVVLPTSFGMAIFPHASNGNIWGEDIVVANQSEFPVEVTLKSAQVNIDHAMSSVKDAKLNLGLKLHGNRNSVLELQEGYSMPETCFVLEPRNPDTDAVALQNDLSEKTVLSGDYAIANIRGTIAKGSEDMWKDGDITVALTFTFRKVEESEEED